MLNDVYNKRILELADERGVAGQNVVLSRAFRAYEPTGTKVEGGAIRPPIIGSRSTAEDATAAVGKRREVRWAGAVSVLSSAEAAVSP